MCHPPPFKIIVKIQPNKNQLGSLRRQIPKLQQIDYLFATEMSAIPMIQRNRCITANILTI